MTGVHNADSHLLAGDQDGRDVSPDESEDVLDPVGSEDSGHTLAAVPRTLHLCLNKVRKPRANPRRVTD